MPFKIQRVPRFLNNLLTIFGGTTPTELEDRIRGTIDLMQVYGAPQRQLLQANNAALAELAALTAVSPTVPFLLFGASIIVTKTATMTALRASLWLGISPTGYRIATEQLGPFGATETGAAAVSLVLPYPMLLPPSTGLFGTVDILGTDATAAVAVSFDVAPLS